MTRECGTPEQACGGKQRGAFRKQFSRCITQKPYPHKPRMGHPKHMLQTETLSRHADLLACVWAARRMASMLRSTSSSMVDQLQMLMRIAVRPFQMVPAHQHVPSS
jgi:hypothetical protein